MKTKLNISERILLLRVIDVLSIVSVIFFANYYLDFNYIDILFNFNIIHITTLVVLYTLTAQVFQMFHLRDAVNYFKTIKNLLITTFLVVFIYLLTPIITPSLPSNRIQVFLFFGSVFIPVLLWRLLYIMLFSKGNFYRKVIVIAGDKAKLENLFNFIEEKSDDHLVHSYLSTEKLHGYDNYLDLRAVNLEDIILKNNIKELIISLEGFSKEELEIINHKLVHYYELGINITSTVDYIEEVTQCVPEENLTQEFYKYFKISKSHENRLYLLAVRSLDIFTGLLGLSFAAIVIPFVFIVNLFANKGGLFYSQKRVGEKGKVFSIVKFRSMVTTAEKDGAQWAKKNDNRITPFGKFLRKTRLDEIPQFWNILIGDMSLIGPRPERPEFVTELEQQIPLYSIRHAIKPGLTGWAQVKFPYASTMEEQKEKLRYDLYYIKQRSLFIDFRIIIRTINTVLYFKGQ